MEVMSRNVPSSTLNPNAPMFVPSAYRHVEDFSDQWWDLVQSTPWFRDYWLQECFSDSQNDHPFSDNFDTVLPDDDTIFGSDIHSPKYEEKEVQKDLIPLGTLKWRKSRTTTEMPRLYEKAPKIVNIKVSRRPIQQPR